MAFIACSAAFAAASETVPTVPSSAPNIILITADTFRPDRLGVYDGALGESSVSPHLDTLSSEGVFFRQAFTTSAWTTPGLISIHTSLHAPVHGVDVRGRSLDPSVTTLAEALTAAGYRAPGLFFLNDMPNFSHLGMDETFPGQNRYLRYGDEVLFHWLENESVTDERPFFAYYHYRDLHQPYAPGAEFEEPYLQEVFGSAYNPFAKLARMAAAEKMELVQREIMLVRELIEFDPSDKDWVRALYDAQIRRMDEQFFRRLRSTLVKTGLANNTLLLISADHGEELLDHGLIGHVSTFKEGRLYDELIRIPLIAWFPGRLPSGRVIDDPVQCIDVMPTVLELAGVPVPAQVQGRSLLPLIAQAPGWEPRAVFCETSGGGYTADARQYADRTRAVRTQRWKLIQFVPGDGAAATEELYALDVDPRERNNVAAQYPGIADSLRLVLQSWAMESQARKALSGQLAQPVGIRESQTDVLDDGPRSDPPSDSPSESLRIIYPLSGDTLEYVGAGQTIRLRWAGDGEAQYVIEYSVGEGNYHLTGELSVVGNEPAYGPFHSSFWNSLVLYNPWHFRVRRADASSVSASSWVTFNLAASQIADGTPDAATLLMPAAILAGQGASEVAHLVVGLAAGLFELAVWVTHLPAADVSAWLLIGAIVVAAAWPRLSAALGVDRCRVWGITLAYIGIVYSTLGVFPVVWRRLHELSEGSIEHLGTAVALIAVTSLLWMVRRRAGQHSWTPYVAIALITPTYAYLLFALSRFPAERLHLLEYGLMAYLVLRALQLDLADRHAYAWSLVLTTVIGLGDEIVQWVLPQRYFEVKDVVLNMVSGGLALLVIRFAIDYGAENRPRARVASPT